MIKEIETIRKMSSRTENMLQLAEEANELAVASIRLCNSSNKNPENNANFIEEIADVRVCIDVIGDYANNIKSFKLDQPLYELLQMLIKHCCQLSKAAIKLRRTIEPNAMPTPISESEAEFILTSEITNVKSLIDSIGNYWDCDAVKTIYKEKAIRSINRLSIQLANQEKIS